MTRRRRRASRLVVGLAAIAAAVTTPREVWSQPITPVRPREPETIPLFPRPITTPREILQAPLALRDARLGLGASGQIVATVHQIAEGQAPRDGRGILRVFIDENGRASRVTSTSPSWDAVARAIRTRLQGRTFALPAGARHVTLWFDVIARSTSLPAVLTGEASQSAATWPRGVRGSSPSDAPAPVVLVPVESLFPVPRHVVSVTLFRVEPR